MCNKAVVAALDEITDKIGKKEDEITIREAEIIGLRARLASLRDAQNSLREALESLNAMDDSSAYAPPGQVDDDLDGTHEIDQTVIMDEASRPL